MKIFLGFAIILMSYGSHAQSLDPRIKSWKTFRSDNGFEFKYPDCWKVRLDNPKEKKIGVFSAHEINIEETSTCSRPPLNPPQQNVVGFSSGWHKLLSKEEALKEIEILERNSANKILRKDWFYFKHFKIGNDDVVVYVESFGDARDVQIRWNTEIYCPTEKISFGGPAIKNPDKSYYDKFKLGYMAMPEPEKTIFESIRCITPRNKDDGAKIKK